MSTTVSVDGTPTMKWTKKQLMGFIRRKASTGDDTLEGKVVRLEGELAASHRAHVVDMAAAAELKTTLEEENRALKAQLADGLAVREEVVTDHELLVERDAEIESLKVASSPSASTDSNDDALKDALKTAYEQLNTATAEVAAFKAQHETMSTELATLKENLRRARQSLADSEAQLLKASEEIPPMRGQLAAATAQYENLQVKHKKLQSQNASLTQHVKSLEAVDASKLEAALAAANEAATQSDKLVNELRQQLAAASENELTKRKTIECGQCPRLKDEIDGYRAQLSTLRVEMETKKATEKVKQQQPSGKVNDAALRRTVIGRRHPLYGMRR